MAKFQATTILFCDEKTIKKKYLRNFNNNYISLEVN